MSVDTNKDLIRRYYEEWFPANDVEHLLERVADDFVNHASPPGSPTGPENIKALAQMLADAFSDQSYDIHHVIGEDEHIVIHCTWKATHTGEFMGIPATSKTFAADQVHVFRLADDKVAEHWAVRDDLSMLRQMGIAPG